MKAIKTIMIVLTIIGVIMEGVFFAVRIGADKELESVKTNHTSYACEVSQADGGYVYSYSNETYSEADYIKLLNDASKAMNLFLAIQSSLIGFYIIAGTAAGRSAKKNEQIAQPAIC